MGITNMETILAHLLKVEEYFQKWKETVPLSMKKALKEQLHKNPNYRKAVTLRPCMYWLHWPLTSMKWLHTEVQR